MSPKRKPHIDRRWERTPGTGLILPRHPSRERYIQDMGTAQDCCGETIVCTNQLGSTCATVESFTNEDCSDCSEWDVSIGDASGLAMAWNSGPCTYTGHYGTWETSAGSGAICNYPGPTSYEPYMNLAAYLVSSVAGYKWYATLIAAKPLTAERNIAYYESGVTGAVDTNPALTHTGTTVENGADEYCDYSGVTITLGVSCS